MQLADGRHAQPAACRLSLGRLPKSRFVMAFAACWHVYLMNLGCLKVYKALQMRFAVLISEEPHGGPAVPAL